MPSVDVSQLQGMNPWEEDALRYRFPNNGTQLPEDAESASRRDLQDPIIYPGIYSSSGLDVMSILFRVFGRPNPQISLGAVDASVAITISNLDHPGHPIIYASDAFLELTGFSRNDILGKTALFIQAPLSQQLLEATPMSQHDLAAVQMLQRVMHSRSECQIQATSYKKSGERFGNMISIVPIYIPEIGANYAVCFNGEC